MPRSQSLRKQGKRSDAAPVEPAPAPVVSIPSKTGQAFRRAANSPTLPIHASQSLRKQGKRSDAEAARITAEAAVSIPSKTGQAFRRPAPTAKSQGTSLNPFENRASVQTFAEIVARNPEASQSLRKQGKRSDRRRQRRAGGPAVSIPSKTGQAFRHFGMG